VIESGFIIFRITHNKWRIVEVQGIGWPKWDTSLILIWTSSSTTCFNSHSLPQRTPQLPLVTFDHLCWNCKHVVSHLGLKIGVAKRLVSQLGVVILQHCNNTLANTGFQHYRILALNNSKFAKMKILKFWSSLWWNNGNLN
jgi:hypothetical protein